MQTPHSAGHAIVRAILTAMGTIDVELSIRRHVSPSSTQWLRLGHAGGRILANFRHTLKWRLQRDGRVDIAAKRRHDSISTIEKPDYHHRKAQTYAVSLNNGNGQFPPP